MEKEPNLYQRVKAKDQTYDDENELLSRVCDANPEQLSDLVKIARARNLSYLYRMNAIDALTSFYIDDKLTERNIARVETLLGQLTRAPLRDADERRYGNQFRENVYLDLAVICGDDPEKEESQRRDIVANPGLSGFFRGINGGVKTYR